MIWQEHNSVLHSAASRGTVEMVKMIVETRRLDINAQTLKVKFSNVTTELDLAF